MVPATALATGETASLLDVQAQQDMEFYASYLCWPVVNKKSISVSGDGP